MKGFGHCYGALLALTIMSTLCYSATGLPQGNKNQEEDTAGPMPYEFHYEVKEKEAKPSGIFMRHEEKSEGSGRTEGEYQVWLPDGRLMKVAYYVDGESGFVPTVTFEDNHVPSW